jgi:rubrerythrin
MTTPDNAVQSILRTAIQREVDAYNLYTTAAKMVETAHVREMLTDLGAQEAGHRAKLEALLKGRTFRALSRPQEKKVVDLRLTDYLVEEPLAPDSDFQTVLIVAGKREKASHDLYTSMAQVAEDGETSKLFQFLANEELAHKNRIEKLYEDLVLKDN